MFIGTAKANELAELAVERAQQPGGGKTLLQTLPSSFAEECLSAGVTDVDEFNEYWDEQVAIVEGFLPLGDPKQLNRLRARTLRVLKKEWRK